MTISWLIFWASALATYRLTVFVSRDRGPADIFVRLRRNWYLGKWSKCPFCVSPYMASLVSVVLWFSGVQEPFGMWVILTLSWSAVTIALDRTFSVDVVNN